MDEVRYPDVDAWDILSEATSADRARPLVLSTREWDQLATAPPTIIPELAKLFSEPSIFDE